MSFDKFKAMLIAEGRVAEIADSIGVRLSIIEEKTVGIDAGWIFFYNSTNFLKYGDIVDFLAGNGPIYITNNGTVYDLPSNVPWHIGLQSITS